MYARRKRHMFCWQFALIGVCFVHVMPFASGHAGSVLSLQFCLFNFVPQIARCTLQQPGHYNQLHKSNLHTQSSNTPPSMSATSGCLTMPSLSTSHPRHVRAYRLVSIDLPMPSSTSSSASAAASASAAETCVRSITGRPFPVETTCKRPPFHAYWGGGGGDYGFTCGGITILTQPTVHHHHHITTTITPPPSCPHQSPSPVTARPQHPAGHWQHPIAPQAPMQ